MNPTDEIRMFSQIDSITNSAVEQLCRERDFRNDLRVMTEGLSEDDRVKLLNILANYAYDKLSMHSDIPKTSKVSLTKAHDYFAHALRIVDWQNRRDELISMWDELEDVWNGEMPGLVDDDEANP